MRVVERQFSEFLRQPNDVVAQLEEHDVVLRRRNAPSLRLSQADRDQERSEAFLAAARLLRNLAVHQPGTLDAALLEAFAWTRYLPGADQRDFVADLTGALVASAELDSYSAVGQLLREWRATAEIHADPRLAAQLRVPIAAEGSAVAIPAG